MSRPWSGGSGGTRSRPLRISDAETRKENVELRRSSESATSTQRSVDASRSKPGSPAPGRITRSNGATGASTAVSSGKSVNAMKMLKEHNDKNAEAHENSGTESDVSDDEEFKPKQSDNQSQNSQTINGYKSDRSSSENNESETEDLQAEIEYHQRRRSTRTQQARLGTYDIRENSASWMVGGGGEARGYHRVIRPRRHNLVQEDSDDDSDVVQDVHRRHSDRLKEQKHSHVNVVPHSMQNGDAQVADSGENEDMYSRVKRRSLTTTGSRKYRQSPDSEQSSIPQNCEPISRRLRDRKKIIISSNIDSFVCVRDSKLTSKVRRKRGRDHSSSSSSSSDSDNKRMGSPSKKLSNRKFIGDAQSSSNQFVGKKEMKMLMEVQPIAVDPSITFKSVGGLSHFIDKLKEIVLFPLLYHQFYEQMAMNAPKGILLHGPPGTGKTLLARALANECCNINGQKVTFFLRKGADLLNKFVGESERQLRMLFQQAAQHRPSIIFFDEIDGLAPVRSAKSEQIHNSIVSSLLAEIDGLQDRGQVIVMGSTNRLDFVDPALRRPGRFDLELPIFLPNRNGRREILDVHVSKWKNPVPREILDELADRTIAFNGADLKLLCWAASMSSLRRTYPQIYGSSQKYLLDYNSIKVVRNDWEEALSSATPSTQRSIYSTYSPAQPLPVFVEPLLKSRMLFAKREMDNIFNLESLTILNEPSYKRLLFHSDAEFGLNAYIVPALFHTIETVPVHVLSFEALHMDGLPLEDAVTQKCLEISRQTKPCVCYIPDFDRLCELLGDAAKEILIRLMKQSTVKPILFLATVEGILINNFRECRLMNMFCNHTFDLQRPSALAIEQFFKPAFDNATKVKFLKLDNRIQEELPFAPPEPINQKLSDDELKMLEKKENSIFRELRIFLRQILTKIAKNKKFEEFTRPVDITQVPDYRDVIVRPMDFESMMHKLNSSEYFTAEEFIKDIHLIVSNCLAYNPDKNESDKRLRMRAHELMDYTEKLIEEEMDSDFEHQCQKIIEERKKRNSEEIAQAQPSQNVQASQSFADIGLAPSSSRVCTGESSPRVLIDASLQISGSRPSTAGSTAKKRKKGSSWSKGTIKKKVVRRPSRLTSLKTSSRNLEASSFGNLDQSSQQEEEIEPAGCSSQMQSPTAESGSDQPRKLSVVSLDSSNASSQDLNMDISRPMDVNDEGFYSCQDEIRYIRLFQGLLRETSLATYRQRFTVMALIDFRCKILKLVYENESNEDKERLYQLISNLIKVNLTNKNTPKSLDFPSRYSSSSSTSNRAISKVRQPASSAPSLRFARIEQTNSCSDVVALPQRKKSKTDDMLEM